MFVGLIAAFFVTVFDQVTKALVFGYLAERGQALEVSSFFNLVSAWNTGVSFSMFNDLGGMGVYILSAFSLIVVGFLLYWLKKEQMLFMKLALGFVIGGALGNVIDRLRLGAVFDFLDVHIGAHHWPAFNVADSFICIGALMIIFDGLFFSDCSQKRQVKEG